MRSDSMLIGIIHIKNGLDIATKLRNKKRYKTFQYLISDNCKTNRYNIITIGNKHTKYELMVDLLWLIQKKSNIFFFTHTELVI